MDSARLLCKYSDQIGRERAEGWCVEVLQVSARGDYAVRTLVALALTTTSGPRKGDRLAAEQGIPYRFLEVVLADLRAAGLVQARRGHQGGYWLGRLPEDITVLEVLDAIGAMGEAPARPPVTTGRDDPTDVDARGIAEAADVLWSELVRTNRAMLAKVTIADLARRSAIAAST